MIKRIVIGLGLFAFTTWVMAQHNAAPAKDENGMLLSASELQQRRDALRAAVQAGRMPPPHDDTAGKDNRPLSSHERAELRQQLRQQRREAARPAS